MWELIKFFLIGHSHKWKTIKETPLEIIRPGGLNDCGIRYFQQCEGCGKVIKRDLA